MCWVGVEGGSIWHRVGTRDRSGRQHSHRWPLGGHRMPATGTCLCGRGNEEDDPLGQKRLLLYLEIQHQHNRKGIQTSSPPHTHTLTHSHTHPCHHAVMQSWVYTHIPTCDNFIFCLCFLVFALKCSILCALFLPRKITDAQM